MPGRSQGVAGALPGVAPRLKRKRPAVGCRASGRRGGYHTPPMSREQPMSKHRLFLCITIVAWGVCFKLRLVM